MARKQMVGKKARSYGVYLSDEQRDRINILAFLRQKTRSEIIRDLIQDQLDIYKKQIDAIITSRNQINNE